MLKPCLDCHSLTTGTRCPPCRATQEQRRGTPTQRGYDHHWRTLAKTIIAAEPWCHTQDGCPYPDAGSARNPLTGDHITPGTLDCGVQVLCRRCNSAKKDRLPTAALAMLACVPPDHEPPDRPQWRED